MKNKLTEAIGLIDEKHLNECYEKREKRKRTRNKVKPASAAAACLAVVTLVSAMIPQIAKRNEPHTLPETTVGVTEPAELPIIREEPYPWQDGYTGDMHGSGGIGGTTGCPEHDFSYYHAIDGRLIALVGRDVFDKWVKDHETYGVEGFCDSYTNIKNFIDDFCISRETFDELIDLTSLPYNLDILFSYDAEYVDKYYKSNTFIARMERRTDIFSNLKEELKLYITALPTFDADATYSFNNVLQNVTAYQIDRDTLCNIMEKARKKTAKLYGDDSLVSFNYDLDMLYNEDGTTKDITVYYDADDTELERCQKLNEAFCRVYEDWGNPSDYPDPEETDKRVLGEGICTVHHRAYHSIPLETQHLPDGFSEYQKIIESTKKDSGDCRLSEYNNIRAFIDYFGLSKEYLLENSSLAKFIDPDYLLSASPAEIEEYFTDLDARETDMYKIYNYKELCSFIYGYYNAPDGSPFEWVCVPYMVREAKISRDELEAIIAEVKRRREATNLYYCGFYNSFDYNLDFIYNEDGSFKKLPEIKHTGYYNDMYREANFKFCGLIPIE